MTNVGLALNLAIEVARDAGRLARESFHSGSTFRIKGESNIDVITDTDIAAEELIVERILAMFPDHSILAEERGSVQGKSEWRWLVDPLDGTNNFAMNLPLYGVCIGLLRNDEPVLAVLHDSHNDITVWAKVGAGAFRQHGVASAQPLRTNWPVTDLRNANTSFVVGYAAVHSTEHVRIEPALEITSKRLHRTWAPCIDGMMLAAGGMDAIVFVASETWDALPVLLIARECGAEIRNYDGSAWNDWSRTKVDAIVASPALIDDVVAIVSS